MKENIVIWVLLISMLLRNISYIVLGLSKQPVKQSYDNADVIMGIFNICVVIILIMY